METKIQLTPIYSLLIETRWDESRIFILAKRSNKEHRYFYTERLFREIKDWDNRELEAHMDAIHYASKSIIKDWDLGGRLLSGEYIPGGEHAGYEVIYV